MIMLSPIAIGYYMDTLQKGRYRKVFGVVESIAFLNALICSALHILGGFSVSQNIQYEIVTRAKRSLIYTSKSVKDPM